MKGESKKDPSMGNWWYPAVEHIWSLLFAKRSLIQQKRPRKIRWPSTHDLKRALIV